MKIRRRWQNPVQRDDRVKAALESSPDDLDLAKQFWARISGAAGYDIRDGKTAGVRDACQAGSE